MIRIPNRGLTIKMVFTIFSSIVVIFAAIFIYNYILSKEIIQKKIKEDARSLTYSTVNKIEQILISVSTVPDNLAGVIESSQYSEKGVKHFLKLVVENNKAIHGISLAFEPYLINTDSLYNSYYFYRESNTINEIELGANGYDYFTKDWYLIPKELEKPVWSEPYYHDIDGNNLTSYSVPLYKTINGKKKFIGVLSADLSLDWLHDIVSSIKIYGTGYAFMVSKSGCLVAHPLKQLMMNYTIFSLGEEKNTPILWDIGRGMIKGDSSFAEIEYINLSTGKNSWISYAPIKSNGWSVGIVWPVEELMADMYRLNRTLFFLALFGAVILLTVIIFISRSITSPLRHLAVATNAFAMGNYNVLLPVINSRDEIGNLYNSFKSMQDALKSTMQKLNKSYKDLAEYNKTLEEKVEQRTKLLTEKNNELDIAFKELQAAQAQLVQSEKMASLGQLTAGIAHEIKNPLNFVNNFAELSIELAGEIKEEVEKCSGSVPPDVSENILEILQDLQSNIIKINEHGKRADSIVKGMLLHSRGKAGEMQKTDINALLMEYVNLAYHGFRAQDSSFNVKIETSYDQSLPPVNVVPQDISRVFLNIINNACYSVHEKKKEKGDKFIPTVSICTKVIDGRIQVKIRDNGKGMPEEIVDKIFNPFFTTKPAGKGTGLGLSLSYDIVVQVHKGEIKVESEEGEFAEFTINLPGNL